MISRRSLSFLIFGLLVSGCMGDRIKANQEQLAQQQAELEQLKQQVVALQNQPARNYSAPLPQPGSCDEPVMREAMRKGGQLFSNNQFGRALDYYRDAVTACPKNGRAQLNLARTYEAVGDRALAIKHYKLAVDASAVDRNTDTVAQARDALRRLQK